MRKVKIIRVSEYFCYECEGQHNIFPASIDWEEVSDERYYEILDAVNKANLRGTKCGEKFVLVSYVNEENDMQEVFRLASEFTDRIKKDEAKRVADKEAAAEKRKATALVRKQKQFDKLKKELEG